MTKVMIVANSTHGGGAENAMRSLSKILANQGFATTFVALNDMDDGISVSNENVVFIGRKWSEGFLRTKKHLGKFRRVVKTHKPDLIIANCELPELFTALVSLGNSKLIIVEHTSKPWEGRRFLGYLVRVILFAKRSNWVTVNSSQSKTWPLNQSTTFIPNTIVSVKKDGREFNGRDIVFVGRLRKEKCPELLIQACQEAAIPLRLFGEGNQRYDLEARYGNSKMTKFLGYLENPWFFVSPESLVVVPSEYEGDGLVVLEAIQNGNAVLLRDNIDLRRFNLSNEHYFKDGPDLTEKLLFFKKNLTSFKVSGIVRDRLLDERSATNIGKKWSSFIENSIESLR